MIDSTFLKFVRISGSYFEALSMILTPLRSEQRKEAADESIHSNFTKNQFSQSDERKNVTPCAAGNWNFVLCIRQDKLIV